MSSANHNRSFDPKQIHLLFLIENMQINGGARRTVSYLIQKFSQLKFVTTLMTLDEPSSPCAFPIDSRANRIYLGEIRSHMKNSSYSRLSRLLSSFFAVIKLRAELKKLVHSQPTPIIILAFLPNLVVYGRIASLGLPIKFISNELSNPKREFSEWSRETSYARSLAYALSDIVTVQTEGAARSLAKSLRKKVRVIPNFIDAINVSWPDTRRKVFLGMGRLVPNKGFDLLIRAFAKISDLLPDWKLEIAGSGTDRVRLLNRISELNLENRVELVGPTNDPDKLFREAEIFTMTSEFEGFPNVLLEALKNGAACISTDCEFGPREVLQNQSGVLIPVNDVDALAESMKNLAQNKEMRESYRLAGRKRVSEFAWEKIESQWISMFQDLLGQSHVR